MVSAEGFLFADATIQKNNRKLQYKGSLNRGFLLFYTETDILLTEQNQQKKGVKLNIL